MRYQNILLTSALPMSRRRPTKAPISLANAGGRDQLVAQSSLKRLVTACGTVLMVGLMATISQANTTVNWDTTVTSNTGSTRSFDTAILTFPGFTSDSLDSMGGGSPSSFHSHSGLTNIFLDLRLDSVWTQVFTTSTSTGNPLTPISTLPPILFPTATVDGIRWNSAPFNSITFHGFNDGTFSGTQTFFEFSESPTLDFELDIKPGPSNNTVPLNGNGTLQMAILANEEFNVMDVNIASLLFGDPILVDGGATPLGATSDRLRDLNHDGLDDLLVGFSISDLVDGGALDASSVEGRLTGELLDGTQIIGSDVVRMVPQNNNVGGLAISAVPEPTTSALVLAALCLVMSRRRAF